MKEEELKRMLLPFHYGYRMNMPLSEVIYEFDEDIKLFTTVKRMLSKKTKNSGLLLNNVVLLHNAFGKGLLKAIPFVFADESQRLKINAILTILNYTEQNLPYDENFYYELTGRMQ